MVGILVGEGRTLRFSLTALASNRATIRRPVYRFSNLVVHTFDQHPPSSTKTDFPLAMASNPSPTKTWHNDTYASISPSNPALSVKGKNIIITGGGYGIVRWRHRCTSVSGLTLAKGREDVLAFAEAGAAEIAILGRKESPLNETKQLAESKFPNTKVTVYVADITDPKPVKTAAEKIGTWDIMIMNAGYMAKKENMETADLSDWWTTFEVWSHNLLYRSTHQITQTQVNIKGQFILIQAFMPTRGKNAVVVGTSTGGVVFPEAYSLGHSSYMVSKFAIIKFMQVVATEYPDVHVVTIHPGVIETAMYYKAQLEGLTFDTIQLAAHFTLWVTSEEARFGRGRFLWCNWDVDELKAKVAEIEANEDLFRTTIGGWPFQPL